MALSTITIDALIKRGWLFLQAPRGLLILAASIALFSAAEMLIKYLTTVWGRLTAKPKIVKHVAKGVSAAVLTGEACRDMNDLALAAEGVAEEYYGCGTLIMLDHNVLTDLNPQFGEVAQKMEKV